MSGTKTVDKSTAAVGDTLNYTITVSNGKKATATLENVAVNDIISEYLTFVSGHVHEKN